MHLLKKYRLLLLPLLLAGCGARKPAAEERKNFCLSDTMAAMIQPDQVREDSLRGELQLNGRVTADEDQVMHIYPAVSGIARSVLVQLGDEVEAGQTLAIISSGEVAQVQSDLSSAQATLQAAQKNFDAASDQYQQGLLSLKDLTDAQSELAKAKAELERSRQLSQLYPADGSAGFVVKAPASGFIIEKNITNGMQIRPDNANALFTISSLDQVWVVADIYETDIAKVKAGYPATIRTLSYPGKNFQGTVEKVYTVLDPDTKVLHARIRLNNPGYLLKPDMFTHVNIRFTEAGSMMAIPSSALIFNLSKNYVVVYHDKCRLEVREVDPYRAVDGITYIRSGLQAGEQVITRYAALVFDAMNE